MSSANAHKLFFIGIGGIGMSGLARYFKRRGAEVAGYDRTPSDITNELQREGIEVQFNDSPGLIPGFLREAPPAEVLVVRTPAVPMDSPLLDWWAQRGANIVKRSELLGLVTRDLRTVAVAGTHGKTTVTTMLAHLLHQCGVRCNAFMGGIAANYGTNVLLDDHATVNVVEADEYDRSFLHLSPSEAIITAMDPDHLEVYGTADEMYATYGAFARKCTGMRLVHERVLDRLGGVSPVRTYALEGATDPRAERVRVEDGRYRFDLVVDGRTIADLELGMPGRHNVENMIAAATMALHVGVEEQGLRRAAANFRGVTRRFEQRFAHGDVVYIDDYAHHPAEIDACVASARELHPGKRITGVFQPHLFSRTRDLAEGFAQSLAKLDELLLLDIYPAREKPIPGVDAEWLLARIPMERKRLVHRDTLASELAAMPLQVLLTMGAGDIDRLVPDIIRTLESQRPR